MTNEQKALFNQEYTLCSNLSTHEVELQIWGGSTKHADLIYRYNNFNSSDYFSDVSQYIQFIAESASKLLIPYSARRLLEYGISLYEFIRIEDELGNCSYYIQQ